MRYGWIPKAAFAATAVAVGCYATLAQDNEKDAKPRIGATTPAGEVAMRAKTSYMPVDATEPLASVKARMVKDKPAVMQKQTALLAERYDLSDRPAKDAKMSRGKPLQEGVRVKLPAGVKSWDELNNLSAEQIRQKNLFPAGFRPLPHANHPEGGMVFHKTMIDELKNRPRET